jgi:Ca2+-binding RTX toxin-like protein
MISNDTVVDGADAFARRLDDISTPALAGVQPDDMITGTAGADMLWDSQGNDTIQGLGGDDTIYSYYGTDSIDGGSGNDYIYAGGARSVVVGGDGNDTISAGGPVASIDAGAGDDTVYLQYASDASVHTGDGNDVVSGSGSNNVSVDLGAGNDSITVDSSTSAWTIAGGVGDDTIGFGSGGHVIDAGAGNDRLVWNAGGYATNGNLTITTGTGSDTIVLGLTAAGGAVLHVTDFTTGAGGDRLDLTAMLGQIAGFDHSNPFVSGRAVLQQSGTDTVLLVNAAAPGAPDDWRTEAVFANTTASQFTADNFTAGLSPLGDFVARSYTGTAGNDQASGADGKDTLNGGAGDDTLDGGWGGNDQLNGGNGNDVLLGYSGNDSLTGGAGSDAQLGGTGNDTLRGGTGDDNVFAQVSVDGMVSYVDGLDGGEGNDLVDGGDGNDILIGGLGHDTLTGGIGDDTLYGATDGSTASTDSDVLHGDDGNDVISAGAGDQVYGDAGNDSINLTGTGITADGGAGDDDLYTFASDLSNSTLSGGDGNDTISAITGYTVSTNLSIDGGAGDDVIIATGDHLTINGGSGRDVIDITGNYWNPGIDGAVTITTGADSDLVKLWLGQGNQSIAQAVVITDFTTGAGGDQLDIGSVLQSLGISGANMVNPFLTGAMQLVASGSDTLLQANTAAAGSPSPHWVTVATLQGVAPGALTGDNFAGGIAPQGDFTPHTLTGTAGNDTLVGADGNDSIAGLAGSDLLDGGLGGNDLLQGGDGYDTLLGYAGNDSLDGGTNADALLGGTGNDTLAGGDGDDQTSVYMTYNGGTISFIGLDGGDGNDSIDGGLGNDYLDGGAGNDTLIGGQGNDTIAHVDAADSVTGGAGADLITVNEGNGLYINGGDDGDQILMTGNGAGLILQSTIQGGLGNDTIALGATQGSTVNGGDGNDVISILGDSYGGTQSTGDRITGDAGDDTITVEGYGHTIDLGAGNDQLVLYSGAPWDPQAGAATITTGAGSDTILPAALGTVGYYGYGSHVPTHSSVVTDFTVGAGGDRIDLSGIEAQLGLPNGADPFASGQARLVADGANTRLEVNANGSGFAAALILNGVAPSALTADNFVQSVTPVIATNASIPKADADKTLVFAEDTPTALALGAPKDPDGGAVTIRVVLGGEVHDSDGNSLYSGETLSVAQLQSLVVQPSQNQNGVLPDFVYSVTDDENSTVYRSVHFNVTPVNDAPALNLYDQVYHDTGTTPFGIDLSDYVHDPEDGSNVTLALSVAGGALPSWLHYDPATQVLSGTPAYGTETALTITVTATDAQGASTTSSFNLADTGLWAADFADRGTLAGTSLADSLQAGYDVPALLSGRDGNDTLTGGSYNDTLDGGAGNNLLSGGTGNDTYIVSSSTDVIAEGTGAGIDTVLASVTYTIGANVENLTLTGSGAINGTGSADANVLTGNGAANALSGADGNDTLAGGAGNDTLAGGAGFDHFHFEASASANGVDVLTDFMSSKSGGDVLDFSAFFGASGANIMDGNAKGGDSFDVFTAPTTLSGQNVLSVQDVLDGATPTSSDVAQLLSGFKFSQGAHEAVVVKDTSTGTGYVFFGIDGADANKSLDAGELALAGTVKFSGGGGFDGLVAQSFQIASGLASPADTHVRADSPMLDFARHNPLHLMVN